MRKNIQHFLFFSLVIAGLVNIYQTVTKDCIIASKWETWLLIIVFLVASICYILPRLKKYQGSIFLCTLVIQQLLINLNGILKNSMDAYITILVGVLMSTGLYIAIIPVLKLKSKKWLLFGILLLSLVSLPLITHLFPADGLWVSTFMAPIIILNFILFLFVWYQERKEKELDQLKQAQTQAKLSSLKDQLSPHFLFNTLNTITSISHEESVKDFVDEVANIYRYVLQFNEVDSVKIKQEIDFITSYLKIIKSRMEGGIDFYINITNERILYTSMPPLTLQILVENAIKHNTTSADKPLSIKLFTTEGPMLVVQNYYQPKLSVLPGNETGLKNIAERYRLLYKKEIVVENKNGFFTVKLPIVMA